MAKEKLLLSITLSSIYATILSCGWAFLAKNKFSIWGQLGTGEKFWTILALIYGIVATVSGWLCVTKGWRAAGFVHAILMMLFAVPTLYIGVSSWTTGHGRDNAAAGVLAAADLAFIVVGVLAAICGFAVTYCLFPGQNDPNKTKPQ